MTVPYTDDPTGREQRTEKRAAVMKTLPDSEERSSCDADSPPAESKDEAKLPCESATGTNATEGREDSEKSSVMNENDTEREAAEDESDARVETGTEEPSEEESSEKVQTGGSSDGVFESLRDRDIRIVSEKYAINLEYGVPVKSREQEGSALPEGTFPEESLEIPLSSARDSDVDGDVARMQLQDLRYSLESIAGEIPETSAGKPEDRFDPGEASAAGNVHGEACNPEGELSFHEAVRAGDAKSVAALLARGDVQNLDEPDWNVSGDPPLLVAATNHCLPVLTLLLENGCDPGARSLRGETALHRVILNRGPGNVLKFVGELLKYGCPPGVKKASGGLTALHVLTRQLVHAQCSKNLHHNFDAALQTLELLAKAGPVNAQDHRGRSALHILTSYAVFDDSHTREIEALIGTLLAAGADPSLKNDRGETPLHECLECGALDTAFLLIPHTPTGIVSRYGETPLHIASRKNYAYVVAKLLEHGEDPSVQDADGNTPLHLASARGFHQTISLLVTSPQAQLEKVNLEGLTALQVAAESGFVIAVRILLKAGADPSQTVHYCATTLQRYLDISALIDHELSRRRQLAA